MSVVHFGKCVCLLDVLFGGDGVGESQQAYELRLHLDGGHDDVGYGYEEAPLARAAALEQLALVAVELSADDRHLPPYHLGRDLVGREILWGVHRLHGLDETGHLLVAHQHGFAIAGPSHKAVLQCGDAQEDGVDLLGRGVDKEQVMDVGQVLARLDAFVCDHTTARWREGLDAHPWQFPEGWREGVGALQVAHDKPLLERRHGW